MAPRYCEHLSKRSELSQGRTKKVARRDSLPITESSSTHELNIEDDIDKVRLNADDNSLRRERNIPRFDDRDDSISQRKLLLTKASGRVSGFEECLTRNSFDHCHLESVSLFSLDERIGQFLNSLYSILRK